MFRWYVINTYSGHENKVKQNLEHRVDSMGQTHRIKQVIVPTEQVAEVIAEASGLSSEQLHIAYCPERVLPGRILQELISNDRVIGGLTPAATEAGQAFYASFCHGELLATTARTAELVNPYCA